VATQPVRLVLAGPGRAGARSALDHRLRLLVPAGRAADSANGARGQDRRARQRQETRPGGSADLPTAAGTAAATLL